MRGKRVKENRIIAILKEAEGGVGVQELCRKYGMSDGTFYNWKAKYGGLTVSEAQRLRDECLNENWFLSLDHARRIIEDCRVDYNHARPHSPLGYLTPEEFIDLESKKFSPGMPGEAESINAGFFNS